MVVRIRECEDFSYDGFFSTASGSLPSVYCRYVRTKYTKRCNDDAMYSTTTIGDVAKDYYIAIDVRLLDRKSID